MSKSPSPPNSPKHPAKTVFVEGVLQHKGTVGFVLSEDLGLPDVMVQGPSLKLAADEDRVRVRLTVSPDPKRRTGEIVEVLERARTTAVGIFRTLNGRPMSVPESGGAPFYIADFNHLTPNEEELVVLQITHWPSEREEGKGRLIEVLGTRRHPSVDLKALVRKYELPDAFPEDAIAEAATWGDEVRTEALQGRRLFFDQRVFTIDGADAKDFDDAVSIEPLSHGGWRLGVHIADVSHYVVPGTALDREARRRATSVYLAGHVLPMLPFPLSDGLCSLRPKTIRLVLSCLMEFSSEGQLLSHEIVEGAIRSTRRFTYEDVEQILQGKKEEDPLLVSDVQTMGKLARILRERRFERGSLDFDFPEPQLVLDAAGFPLDILKRVRGESHRLIEEFMLSANETVATSMKKMPFLYRIHETPDTAKLEKLEKILQAAGVDLPKNLHSGHPKALQQLLRSVTGKSSETLVHMMTLRSLKQAVYSDKNAGHFGLASPCYSHFTSPIRRYPDLIVHRIVKACVHNDYDATTQLAWKAALPALAGHCSRRERVAVQAEREFMDLKKVQLMEQYVGDTFDGLVTSVTSFGLFVQFGKEFVEGLVHVSQLRDDYYLFDEHRLTLRGKRTNRTYHLGQQVRVRLAAANVLKRQLDLELLEAPKASKAPTAPRSPGKSSRRNKHRNRKRKQGQSTQSPPSGGNRHPQGGRSSQGPRQTNKS